MVFNRRQLVAATMAAAAATTAAPVLAQGAAKPEATPAEHEAGTIWWNELLTNDPERARAFYSEVVEWTAKPVALEDPLRPPNPGEKEYIVFTNAGGDGAGMMKSEDAEFARGRPAMWLTYIQVANVDAAAFRAVQLGGKLVNEPFDVANVGRIAIIEDLEGARVGLITPRSPSDR
jgi:uncharacterized protein